ncbi:MAG: peptidoglycan editing factor PgeF [Alphaproteobacteria bacterium]|nr:peptidoglycan editing factor PgeF [Alphaproteobacteria bacterium]
MIAELEQEKRMTISAALSAGLENSISYAFFGRQGGVSCGIYATLNIAHDTKDDPHSVKQNRSIIATALGVASDCLLTPFQVHGKEVVIVKEIWPNGAQPKADALVTKKTDIAIGIATADCVPVLFADPEERIIGAAHVGWRGAHANIIDATIGQMERLGSRKSNIIAYIGPSISQENYEVGQDVHEAFMQSNQVSNQYFMKKGDKYLFDIAGYVHFCLKRAEIDKISIYKMCTYANEDHLFSYRRFRKQNELDYGKQISAIVLKKRSGAEPK